MEKYDTIIRKLPGRRPGGGRDMAESRNIDKDTGGGARKKSYGSLAQKIALVIWAALILFAFLNRDKISVDSIIHYTPSDTLAAIVVFLGLFALKTLSMVFYSGLLFTASGLLFGLPLGIAVSIAGALVMLLEGYAIGRAGGHQLVEDMSEKHPKFGEFTGLKDDRPFVFALLLRMLKVVNYDLGSMYMGASGVRLLPYLGGSMTALMPEIILFSLAGSGIGNMEAMPVAVAAVIFIIMTASSALLFRYMMKTQGGTEEK